MQIHELSPHPKARRDRRRLGRGIGSGLGKTSGKGHKGQWARSGGGVRVGFEGGQMPLHRRLPKRGFTNNSFAKVYSVVNIKDLNVFKKGDVVTAEVLKERGILSKIEEYGLKVLGDGKLDVAITVKAAKFTKGAITAIKKAGGEAIVSEYHVNESTAKPAPAKATATKAPAKTTVTSKPVVKAAPKAVVAKTAAPKPKATPTSGVKK